MIIFDLDGTLADCEHRRHFVDRQYMEGCDHWHQIPNHPVDMCDECKKKWFAWFPKWKAFYEACDKDIPIQPIIEIFQLISINLDQVQIWSGRCESVREKTIQWLVDTLKSGIDEKKYFNSILKMRPIGDSTPDDVLKEKWLDEVIRENRIIDFVFDDRPKVIRMWRRRGIFVFNCAQHDGEF